MRYIKPDKEAIAIAIKIPALSLLERVLVAEAIYASNKLIEKVGEKV
jgi:hypothetical protein